MGVDVVAGGLLRRRRATYLASRVVLIHRLGLLSGAHQGLPDASSPGHKATGTAASREIDPSPLANPLQP
jgi:hypothetical protein